MQKAEPHLFIVFGGTGDLMRRKLLPALYSLVTQELVDQSFRVLAVARDEFDEGAYRSWAQEALDEFAKADGEAMHKWCNSCLNYFAIGKGEADDFAGLRKKIEEVESAHELPGNRAFYLALPPRVFPATIEGLGREGLNEAPGWARIVVEKPFGRNIESARELNKLVHQYYDETQVYRIDHYLGKETVQNLLVFRFSNPIFESLWNRDRIDSVQITVAETVGVGTRAGYYDQAGALRDMVQNHLTQLLTLTAMEAPAAFEADAIRNEKVKVLKSITPIKDSDVVFGQYRAGHILGESVLGYTDEENMPEESETETFVALRLEINNWRWQGVPFYLRTGKRMKERRSQIVVTFRPPPVSLFMGTNQRPISPNALILTIQPDEGFDLRIEVKKPGQGIALKTESLDFRYSDDFVDLPDGYETLLHDVLTADQTLFVRGDEVEEAWELYTPLLAGGHTIHTYEAGTWGPGVSDRLLAELGDWWVSL